MKTAKQFSIMMAIVLLSLSINSCHRGNDYSVQNLDNTITLLVDTENITRQNLDAKCRFLPKQIGMSNEDYTTEVTFNDTIIWQGISVDSAIVEIKKIKYQSKDKILTVDVNRNQGNDPKVYAIVKDSSDFNPGIDPLIEKYLIRFKVNGKIFSFKIDPKIQVNRNQ